MNLGLRDDISYDKTVQQLEKSFNKHFSNKLKLRMEQEYPHMKKLEYRWKLLELKRYFVMASLLKQVPMFSDEVDELWHEMLMFTKSYADFCAEFMGSTVHHEPAVTRRENPGARAWFDWVYCQLFEFTPYSSAIWGEFFSYPISGELQTLIAQGDRTELVNQFFHTRRLQEDPEAAQVISYLIEKLQRSASLSEKSYPWNPQVRSMWLSSWRVPWYITPCIMRQRTECTWVVSNRNLSHRKRQPKVLRQAAVVQAVQAVMPIIVTTAAAPREIRVHRAVAPLLTLPAAHPAAHLVAEAEINEGGIV